MSKTRVEKDLAKGKLAKTSTKEVTMEEKDAKAVEILNKKAKTHKKTHHLSTNGRQLINTKTREVECAICLYMAKVTMPKGLLKDDTGCRPCESNKHMTWVPKDHKKLAQIFEQRITEPKTMLEFEAEAYDGKPSPARQKALNASAKAKAELEDLKAEKDKATKKKKAATKAKAKKEAAKGKTATA
jgi:hypothetical protein